VSLTQAERRRFMAAIAKVYPTWPERHAGAKDAQVFAFAMRLVREGRTTI